MHIDSKPSTEFQKTKLDNTKENAISWPNRFKSGAALNM